MDNEKLKETHELALYSLYGGEAHHLRIATDRIEEDTDWCRLTEKIEINFELLSETITTPLQIEAINNKIKLEKSDTAERVAILEERIRTLQAITHNPGEPE